MRSWLSKSNINQIIGAKCNGVLLAVLQFAWKVLWLLQSHKGHYPGLLTVNTTCLTLFAHTFAQVEAYPNQMEPVLDALKYLTPYGFDALTYTLLARLTLDRAKVRSLCLSVVVLGQA